MRQGIKKQNVFEMTKERMVHGFTPLGLSDIKVNRTKDKVTLEAYSEKHETDITVHMTEQRFELSIQDMSATFEEPCTLQKIEEILTEIK